MRLTGGHEAVDAASRFAATVVGHCDAECREATTLVVSELAENMVKYGPPKEPGAIAIGVEEELVRVRATNVVESETDARQVVGTVSRIAAAAQVRDLYRDRLRELFDNPGLPRAQLGLLRVAFEGGFQLSCNFKAPVLEIVAERHGPTR
jgi:hypothetical protein